MIGSISVTPYLGYRLEYFPGDLTDARLNMYFLEHGYKWLSGLTPHSFFDAPFYYPVRGVIKYSDNLLGALPFYAPWRWLGFDRETSFQFWIVVGFLLNYLATFWVLQKMEFHWIAVLFGAYTFAFSHVALARLGLGHIQLHYRFAVPLAWYFLCLFLEQFSWKDLLACLLFVAWQFYCSLYLGYFLVLFLALFVLVTIGRKPVLEAYFKQATKASVTTHMVVSILFISVVAALAYPYMQGTGDAELLARRWQETLNMLPRPVSYLMSSVGNVETGWLSEIVDVPMKHEHVMFVGVIPWFCVFCLLLTVKNGSFNAFVKPAILAMLGVVLLTLYVKGFSLYFVLMEVPGVVGMRGVTRSILVLLLPFSVAVAQVVHLSWDKLRNARSSSRLLLLVLAVVAFVVENHIDPYRISKAEAQERLRRLKEQLPAKPPRDAILAYLRPEVSFERQPYELDAMLLTQDIGLLTMNGYSSRMPKGYRLLRTCADLKLVLNNTAQQDEVFQLHDPQSQIVVLGSPMDAPCTELNAPASVQTLPLPDSAFRAKLEIRAQPTVPAESELLAEVRVVNKSKLLWRAMAKSDGKYAIRVGCRFIDKDTQRPLSDYDHHFDLPYDVAPGKMVSTVMDLPSPAVPGAYEIECDAVQEAVHWFHSQGSPLGRSAIIVTKSSEQKAVIEGFLDKINKDEIAGWVWDKKQPNSPIQVAIYDGNTLLVTVQADLFRKDLLEAHIGNGRHGFSIPNPVWAQDGKVHMIRTFVSGKNIELSESPKPFTSNR